MSAKTTMHPYDRVWKVLPPILWGESEARLQEPLRRQKPTVYRIGGDLFHEDVPDSFIDCVLAVIALCPHLTFQVLTKRSKRMREYMSDPLTPRRIATHAGKSCIDLGTDPIENPRWWPLPNLHLYVSPGDQATAEELIPDLLATPAAVRGIDMTMRGAVDLTQICGKSALAYQMFHGEPRRLNHVIVGGESGPSARPMHPDWVRKVRDDCAAAGVAFFFKQWGEHESLGPMRNQGGQRLGALKGLATKKHVVVDGHAYLRVGKSRAGRVLDGKTHDGKPGSGA